MSASLQNSDFAHLYGPAASAELSNNTLTITTAQTNASDQSIIVDLVFANSKSMRTSIVILAAFNSLAAFTTVFSIMYDSYWIQSRRCVVPNYKTKKQSLRRFCVSKMHPAETFPLILNMGIGIQSFVFAGVQGTGLNSLFIDGCSIISQFMWTALFIVPYMEVVFGLECVRRACRHKPFQARGKYDVTVCLVIVLCMLIGTWVPIHTNPQPDHCFASLLWFISGFGEQGFILLAVSLGLSIVSAIVICVRLSTFTLIDQQQRIAASRMVYYLILGSVVVAFVIPYFALITLRIASTTSSMIAMVVLNLSGLMTAVLQLFLRSNTTTASFKPKNTPNWSGDKHDIRLFGPNELGFGGHLLQPVLAPGVYRSESQRSMLSWEKEMNIEPPQSPPAVRSPQRAPAHHNPLRSNAYEALPNNPDSKLPTIPGPTAAGSSARNERKPSYSLYPAEESSSPKKTQPPTATTSNKQTSQPVQTSLSVPQSKFQTMSPQEPSFAANDAVPEETFFGLSSSRPEADSVYSIGALLPPPLFRNNSRHKRNSSYESTTTVQIGLRISHAQPELQIPHSPDRLVDVVQPISLPSTTYRALNSKQDPILPIPVVSPATAAAASSIPPVPSLNAPHRPSPLAKMNNAGVPARSNTLPSSPRPVRSVPTAGPIPERVATPEGVPQLSPAVYSPLKSQAHGSTIARSNSRNGCLASPAFVAASSPTRSNPLGRQGSNRTQRRHESDDDDAKSVEAASRWV